MSRHYGEGWSELGKARSLCAMIAEDMAHDATTFDGQPFTGRTVAEYFGNQGAAIAALAGIIKGLIDFESAKSVENASVSSGTGTAHPQDSKESDPLHVSRGGESL